MVELLIVIGMIGVLTSIVLVAVNPRKQLCDARNAQRKTMVREIGNALQQHTIRKSKSSLIASFPLGQENAKPICRPLITGEATCISLTVLLPDYLVTLPIDPNEEDFRYTGYSVYRDNGNRAVVLAPHAETCSALSSESSETSSLTSLSSSAYSSLTSALPSSVASSSSSLTLPESSSSATSSVPSSYAPASSEVSIAPPAPSSSSESLPAASSSISFSLPASSVPASSEVSIAPPAPSSSSESLPAASSSISYSLPASSVPASSVISISSSQGIACNEDQVYGEENGNYWAGASSPWYIGQGFTPGRTGQLNAVQLFHYIGGGTCTVSIWNDNNGLPGTQLISTTSPIFNSMAWNLVPLPQAITVTEGQKYYIVENNCGNWANSWYMQSGNGTYSGGSQVWSDNGTQSWGIGATTDMIFKTCVQ